MPSEAARDFRGILWTFMAWQWVRLKSVWSGKAEEPVVPFRCHRRWLHPAWNLGLVTWKCSQKVLVLPYSSGGKSVVLNYNLKRKKTHTFRSTSIPFGLFFFSQNSSFQEWTGQESKSDYCHDNSWMCQDASRSQAVSKYFCFRSGRPQSDAGAWWFIEV